VRNDNDEECRLGALIQIKWTEWPVDDLTAEA